MLDKNNAEMIQEIKDVIISSRKKVAYEVNNTMLYAYWNVGRIIVENEQNGNIKAEYGKQILKELSKELRKILGSGFSVSNLQYMRRFYLEYPKQQTLSVKLSWSHYCELLSINNIEERNFYEKECINSNWSVRELKRQLETSLFERLLLSEGKKNKEKVYELSKVGQTFNTPEDILKEPYVFEFLGVKENKPIGIILCKSKKDIAIDYALGGLSNNVFASTYTYYIPKKEELINEVEKVLNENK